MAALLNKVWEEEKVPSDWPKAFITTLYKIGTRDNPENYREIALINNINKILTSILHQRFTSWLERCQLLPEEQAGFRSERSTTEHIFILLSTIQIKNNLPGNAIYVISIDLKRAFDTVPHKKMWDKFFQLGVSSKFLRIARDMYDKATVKIKAGEEFTTEFNVSEGVLQGYKFSPVAFNDKDLLALLFADDTNIFGRTLIETQRLLLSLEEYFKSDGLKVNVEKSAILVCRTSRRIKNIAKKCLHG